MVEAHERERRRHLVGGESIDAHAHPPLAEPVLFKVGGDVELGEVVS